MYSKGAKSETSSTVWPLKYWQENSFVGNQSVVPSVKELII